jgi:predicted  nucleic acid-binding Zn-ribbon protein
MNRIANREAEIAANDVLIAELDIIITKAQSEVDELQAEYDAALATPYRAQLLVDIYELYDMIWAKEATIQANRTQIIQNRDIAIAMFGAIRDIVNHEDLMEMIDDCNDEIATLEGEIVGLQADIAAAEATGEVDAANWQALIDLAIDTIGDLEVEIANYMTLADEYLALMNAALED